MSYHILDPIYLLMGHYLKPTTLHERPNRAARIFLSASLHAEVPRQGKDQEMLVRDKDIIRTFEKSAT